jgi:hypothetical protein
VAHQNDQLGTLGTTLAVPGEQGRIRVRQVTLEWFLHLRRLRDPGKPLGFRFSASYDRRTDVRLEAQVYVRHAQVITVTPGEAGFALPFGQPTMLLRLELHLAGLLPQDLERLSPLPSEGGRGTLREPKPRPSRSRLPAAARPR